MDSISFGNTLFGYRTICDCWEKEVVKAEYTKQIANHIKDAQLLIIKITTHYAAQEKPEAFNQMLF